MTRAALAGAAVLIAGSSVFAQASFTPVATDGAFADLSGDGSCVLVDFIHGGGMGPPTINCRIFYRAGGSQDLFPGGGRAEVNALNFSGTAGWGTTDYLGGNGSVRRVSGLSAASSTSYFAGHAYDVSDNEHAVVGYASPRGFIWDPASGPTPLLLQPVSGNTSSQALAVSPGGLFVTGVSWASTFTPTRWTAAGTAMALAIPPGLTNAYGMAVSDTGLSVGYAEGAPVSSQHKGLAWDGMGNVRFLPMVQNSGEALAISADGSVIVGYERSPSTPTSVASVVVWRNGVREDVVALLSAVGVSTAGYTLSDASAISTDGTVIAGNAWGLDGGPRVYFITLPPACVPDVGSAGGLPGKDGTLDNNDFIAFISLFFAADPRADLGVAGGVRGADGAFDNNDFIAFVNAFFAGCP